MGNNTQCSLPPTTAATESAISILSVSAKEKNIKGVRKKLQEFFAGFLS